MKCVHPFPDIDIPMSAHVAYANLFTCNPTKNAPSTTKMLSLEKKFIRLAEIQQNVSRIYA
jgi:hypothetical protein